MALRRRRASSPGPNGPIQIAATRATTGTVARSRSRRSRGLLPHARRAPVPSRRMNGTNKITAASVMLPVPAVPFRQYDARKPSVPSLLRARETSHITCHYLLWLQVFTAEKRHPMHRRSCSKSSILPVSLTLYSKNLIPEKPSARLFTCSWPDACKTDASRRGAGISRAL